MHLHQLLNSLGSDPDGYLNLMTELEVKRYKLEDLDISSKNYNAWKDKGIGFAVELDGKSREVAIFNTVEASYLLMVKQLKRVGVSAKQILGFKNHMFRPTPIFLNRAFGFAPSSVAEPLSNITTTTGNENTKAKTMLNVAKEILDSREVKHLVAKKKGYDISYLHSMLLYALGHKFNAGVVILFDNDNVLVNFLVYDGKVDYSLAVLGESDYVHLNLWEIIQKILRIEKPSNSILQLFPNEFQRKILAAVEQKSSIARMLIKEVANANSLEIVDEKDLPVNYKIELAVGEQSNQDIIVKVRNSKKISVKQIVYKKSKK